MSDAGNVLPQAEIDAIFKHATGRSMAAAEPDAGAGGTAHPSPAQLNQPPAAVKSPSPATAPEQPVNPVFNEILGKLEVLNERITNLETKIETFECSENQANEIAGSVSEYSRELEKEKRQLTAISGTLQNVVTELKNTPGAGMRKRYTCSQCGQQGYMVVPVRCSACGTEGWWGWWPEKK
jgi:uncharacterized coiled-coil protein SlyX